MEFRCQENNTDNLYERWAPMQSKKPNKYELETQKDPWQIAADPPSGK